MTVVTANRARSRLRLSTVYIPPASGIRDLASGIWFPPSPVASEKTSLEPSTPDFVKVGMILKTSTIDSRPKEGVLLEDWNGGLLT